MDSLSLISDEETETDFLDHEADSVIFRIDPRQLINEVERRPALYGSSYPDKNVTPEFRIKLWREVSEILIPHFKTQNKLEQNITVKSLQKKWRNLKDCFRKEHRRLQSTDKSKAKRKYIYYQRLRFLLPIYKQQARMPRNAIITRGSKKVKDEDANTNENDESTTVTTTESIIPSKPVQSNPPIQPNPPIQSTPSTIEDIDEDKHFLLSLVPTFKRMNYEQKLTAKVDILNVLRNIQTFQASTILNDPLLSAIEIKDEMHEEDL